MMSFPSFPSALQCAIVVSLTLLISVPSCTSDTGGFSRESFVIKLAAKEETCFSKAFTKSVKVIFEFRVTEGGNKDVDAKVLSPNGMVIYKERKVAGDEVSFNAGNGDFKFCFSNEFSRFVSKRVAFNIRPYDVASLSEQMGDDQPTVKGALESFCDDVFNLMNYMEDFQMKYRVRESMGRYLAEDLNQRVLWWSVFQSVLIFVTGFGQVFIFKRFFTDKRQSSKPEQAQAQVQPQPTQSEVIVS